MLTEKSLFELSELLEKKETTAEEITQSYLSRIDQHDGALNSYITVHDDAISAAKESDQRRAKGEQLSSLDGIPIAVKDNICTYGVKTTCGSKILENFIPPYNATAYQNMVDKGLVLLGKTNLDEFAMGSTTETSFFGPTKNPYNVDHVPGGSSGGSAVVVSARLAPASLGSDTGGSIRQPASFCGVVGIKPTYGSVSRYGLVAFASSLDQIGTFANTVDDAAELLSIISSYDTQDSTSVTSDANFSKASLSEDIKGMKIGVPEEYFQSLPSDIETAIKDTIKKLESEGAIIEPLSLKFTEYAIPIYYLIATAEASSNLARYDGIRYGFRSPNIDNLKELYHTTRSIGFGKEVKRRIILGTYALSSGYYDAYYLKALQGRKLIIEDFKEAFSKVDAIVTPTTISTAYKIGEMTSDPLAMYMSDILNISANLAGIPGISIPVGKDTKHSLPIGLQIMGNHFKENTILSLAKKIEAMSETLKPVI